MNLEKIYNENEVVAVKFNNQDDTLGRLVGFNGSFCLVQQGARIDEYPVNLVRVVATAKTWNWSR